MCLILYIPPKGNFPFQHFDAIYENNPHGFGMMWVEGDRVKTIKGLFNPDEIRYMIVDGPGEGVAYHFRYTTRGETNDENAHPFVLAPDVAMMHNGTITAFGHHDELSDTALFAEGCKRLIANEGPNVVFNKHFVDNLPSLIGSFNKVMFMGVNTETKKRRVRFINLPKWTILTRGRSKIYLSNTYSLNSDHRKARPLLRK